MGKTLQTFFISIFNSENKVVGNNIPVIRLLVQYFK